MKERRTEFTSAGRTFAGVLFEPEGAGGAPRPGVLVLHGGSGPGAHERDRAGMLAGLGYVAFAPDLFGEVFTSREQGVAVITGLVGAPPVLRARLSDALECLRASPGVDGSRLAAVGYCFGGLAALELARGGAKVRAVVSFHGGLTAKAPAVAGEVNAAVLVCTGAADPFVTREHREAFEDEMTRASVDWQMCTYANAKHGFTERGLESPSARYDEAADRRSWQAMRGLFEEALR